MIVKCIKNKMKENLNLSSILRKSSIYSIILYLLSLSLFNVLSSPVNKFSKYELK